MKTTMILTAVGILTLGAMTQGAHALDLGVGSNTHVGVGGVGVNARTNTGVDASGGMMARSGTNANVGTTSDDSDRDQNYDHNRVYEESDARFHAGGGSNINADTSAGGDENADLRAAMRNQDDGKNAVSDRTSTNATARINANAAANTGGLLGISTGANSRTSLDANQ